MLDHTKGFWVSRQGHQLLNGPKKNVIRALRRFLQQTASPEGALCQVFAYDAGYDGEQLRMIRSYADQVRKCQEKQLPAEVAKCLGVVFDAMFGLVQIAHTLRLDIETASAAELRDAVKYVTILADSMHECVPNLALTCGFDDYQYRGLACDIAPDHQLWCISGQDLRGGASGVLEWCYDETDAQFLLAEMKRFPVRFPSLTAQAWSESQQPLAKAA